MCALPFQFSMLMRASKLGCNTRDRMSAWHATGSAGEQPAARPFTQAGTNKSAGLRMTTATA